VFIGLETGGGRKRLQAQVAQSVPWRRVTQSASGFRSSLDDPRVGSLRSRSRALQARRSERRAALDRCARTPVRDGPALPRGLGCTAADPAGAGEGALPRHGARVPADALLRLPEPRRLAWRPEAKLRRDRLRGVAGGARVSGSSTSSWRRRIGWATHSFDATVDDRLAARPRGSSRVAVAGDSSVGRSQGARLISWLRHVLLYIFLATLTAAVPMPALRSDLRGGRRPGSSARLRHLGREAAERSRFRFPLLRSRRLLRPARAPAALSVREGADAVPAVRPQGASSNIARRRQG
jgi:hypothetical protein